MPPRTRGAASSSAPPRAEDPKRSRTASPPALTTVRCAGMGAAGPCPLRGADFGAALPPRAGAGEEVPADNPYRQRQLVLLETIDELERASPSARYHRLAQANVARWRAEAAARFRGRLLRFCLFRHGAARARSNRIAASGALAGRAAGLCSLQWCDECSVPSIGKEAFGELGTLALSLSR